MQTLLVIKAPAFCWCPCICWPKQTAQSNFLGDRLYAIGLLYVCLPVMLVYCGQTVGRINMKLGMQVGLGPGHIVLGGEWKPSSHYPKWA